MDLLVVRLAGGAEGFICVEQRVTGKVQNDKVGGRIG
jgi:hypothetical protein